jgi:hypothetical protein
VSLPGPAANGPQTVSLNLNTNDPAGATVNVTPSGKFNGGAAGAFDISNLMVTGNSATNQPFDNGFDPVGVDTESVGGAYSLTDTYTLTVPSVSPGTYSTGLNYTASAQ